jgi:hypothetical protein
MRPCYHSYNYKRDQDHNHDDSEVIYYFYHSFFVYINKYRVKCLKRNRGLVPVKPARKPRYAKLVPVPVAAVRVWRVRVALNDLGVTVDPVTPNQR